MTQTVKTPNGRSSVWIEADHGQGRYTGLRCVTWHKVTLAEYLERLDLAWIDEGREESIKATLALFSKGHAYEAVDGDRSEIFATEKEARDWAWSRDC